MAEGPGTALSCTVTWRPSRRAVERLVGSGEAFRFLRLDVAGEQRARVTVTEAVRRVDLEGETLFGAAASLVDDGRTLTCLGHESRQLLSVPRERIPPAGVSDRIAVAGRPRVEGSVVVVDLEEQDSGTWFRQRLELDPAQEAGPLVRRLLEVLFGDAEFHAATGYPFDAVVTLVEEIGAPVAGRVDVVDSTSEPLGELGSFSISDLRYSDEALEPLEGAEQYKDAGDVRRTAALGKLLEKGEIPEELPTVPVVSRPWTADIPVAPFTGEEMATARMYRNGGREPEPNGGPEPPELEPEPEGPPPPPTTTEASFGLLIRQRLLDEITSAVNRLFGPLAGATFTFAGGAGLSMDWLARARAGVLASQDAVGNRPAPGLGTLLFCLAHDVEPPGRPPTPDAGPSAQITGWGRVRGRGLLDREAMREAKGWVTAGRFTDTASPFAPQARALARLAPAVASAVRNAGTDWSRLTQAERLQLAWAVLLEGIGTIFVPLPGSMQKNVDDFVLLELTGYSGTLTMPPTPSPIAYLRCRGSGIDLGLFLGSATLTGTLNRQPGSKYLLALGAGVLVFGIPGLAWIAPLLAAIGVFLLLDTAVVALGLTAITANCQLRFVADGSRVLQPRLTVTVTAGVSAAMVSTVPTEVHQILDWLLTAVATFAQNQLDFIGAALGGAVSGALNRSFGAGFPAALFQLGLPITRSNVAGRSDDHIYLESRIQPPPGTSVAGRSVRADARELALQDAARLPGGPARRHYLSLITSENTLNILLAGAWRREAWDAITLDSTAHTTLQSLAGAPFPAGVPVMMASLRTVAPPRLTLASGTPGPGAPHGTVTADVRLTLWADFDRWFEWTFRLTAPAQVVVGSAVRSSRPKVELLTAFAEPIDVLVDLAQASLQVTGLRSFAWIEQTVEEWIDQWGEFEKVTSVELVPVETQHALTPQSAVAHAPLVLAAARFGWRARDVSRSPRRDGVFADGTLATVTDPITVFTYPFDGSDPDNASRNAFAVADLGFTGGLLFQHLSLAGERIGLLDPDPTNLPLQTPDGAKTVFDLLQPPNLDP